MPSLNMSGPYDLTENDVNNAVSKTSAGNYALGYVNEGGTFIVQYVGRADSDVNERLHDWEGKYKKFKYSYASSPKAAFEKECTNYHDFGAKHKLANSNHPGRPDKSGWKCPKCNIFG